MDTRLVDTMDPGSIPSPWDRLDMRTARLVVLSDGILAKGWKISQAYTVPAGHVGMLLEIRQSIQANNAGFPPRHPLYAYYTVNAKISVGGRQLFLFNSGAGANLVPRIETVSEFPEPGSAGALIGRFVEVSWPLPRPGIPLLEAEELKVNAGPDSWLDSSADGHYSVSILIAQPVSLVRWLEYAMPRRAGMGLPGAEVRGNARE